MKSKEECKRCADKAAFVVMAGNTFLCLFKLTLGILANSHAVVADAMHSGADVINAIITAFSLRISNKPADREHPYGHEKTEFLAGSFVGCVLVIGAAIIMVTSVGHLLNKNAVQRPHIMALVAAVVSIMVNELMFFYTRCAASRTNSSGLQALAWDNQSDAISSIPVFLGVLGAQLGFPSLDPLAALVVGVLVGKIGWEILAKNIGGLMDSPIDGTSCGQIRKAVLAVSGVSDIDHFRTRGMGRHYHLDLEIIVNAQSTVEETGSIVSEVKRCVRLAVDKVDSITVTCESEATSHPSESRGN